VRESFPTLPSLLVIVGDRVVWRIKHEIWPKAVAFYPNLGAEMVTRGESKITTSEGEMKEISLLEKRDKQEDKNQEEAETMEIDEDQC